MSEIIGYKMTKIERSTLVPAGSPVAITTGWTTLGTVNLVGRRFCRLYAKVVYDGSTDIRFKFLERAVSGGDDYPGSIVAVVGAVYEVKSVGYYEQDDSSTLIVIPIDLQSTVPYAKIQVSAGTVVGSPVVEEFHMVYGG
jgi:hypothetical protein